MKIFIVLAILFAGSLAGIQYFRHEGKMVAKKEAGVVFGPHYLEYAQNINRTITAGMFVNSKRVHTPFAITSKIQKIEVENNYYRISGVCHEMMWGMKSLVPVSGITYMNGTMEKMTFSANCKYGGQEYVINTTANYSKCAFYSMAEAAIKAHYLIGESSEAYKAAHVVNHAVFGYSYLTGKDCKYYLTTFGKETNSTTPGVIIVSKKATHCAIVDREGDKFVQSNAAKKQVTSNPLTMLKTFFPDGYVLKAYSC